MPFEANVSPLFCSYDKLAHFLQKMQNTNMQNLHVINIVDSIMAAKYKYFIPHQCCGVLMTAQWFRSLTMTCW